MERSLARGNVYSLLSLCFSYPDDEIYACIAGGKRLREARESLCLLGDDHSEECLRAFEEVSCGRKKATQQEMEREYTRFFSDALPHTDSLRGSTCPGKDRPILEEMTSEVLRFFREAGFTPNQGEIPGHIAHRLEFMSILAKQESKAPRGERIRLEEIQLNFLSRFLIAWVSSYREEVAKQKSLPFYCTLGDLAQEFIDFEMNYLGMPEEKEQDR